MKRRELQVFLRIETKIFFFFLTGSISLAVQVRKKQKSKYIKLTNDSLKVQFPFKITNKQQHQQKEINPNHNPKGKTCGETSVVMG